MQQVAEAAFGVEHTACYHCGEPVPPGVNFGVEIDGVDQPMCCPGCRAVAGLIAGSGLGSFYRRRTAYSERPTDEAPAIPRHNQVYDDPGLAATFTREEPDGTLTASLLLGGITCAACTWLIEKSVGALPGVSQAAVNLQQARLDIRIDPQRSSLSEVFTHIEHLGYRPRPFHTSAAREQAVEERRADLRRLAVAGLGMMQVGMFAIALHAGDLQGIETGYRSLLRWVSFPVTGFIVWYSARPFFTNAWRNLRHGVLVMDLPVALAIGLAFAASVWATVAGDGQVYFDSVVMFTFLLLLGRFLEQRVRQRQLLDYSDAESALPDAVTVNRHGRWSIAPRATLEPGDKVLIRAGETVPVDARIIDGTSAVREDAFNGEHLPRSVCANDTIYAGTLNIEAKLEGEVLVDYRDSRLAALQRSVNAAQTSKPRLAMMADRVASWFVAVVLVAAAATGAVWLQLAPDKAIWIMLSVLMVSCPCALALATPTALTSAANALRRRGVLVRGENALETLSRCSHLVLDKTGTLTEGTPTVSSVRSLGSLNPEQVLSVTAALQRYASHPLSSAFTAFADAREFDTVDYRVGAGIEGVLDGTTYRVGSLPFLRELLPTFPATPDEDLYWVGLCRDGEALAWIGLDDRVRTESQAFVETARKSGLHIEILTGDSSPRGRQLGGMLGIKAVSTGQSPLEKMQHVRELQAAEATVAMVGDGLNDAPVLAVADTSFAVAGATDLARSQADFVIVDNNLDRISEAFDKAHQCRSVIRQNFAWALTYNLGAMPLAALGHVPPWAAAIGMSLSSLLVLANSLRLNRPHANRVR